jgi:hypothetical protein
VANGLEGTEETKDSGVCGGKRQAVVKYFLEVGEIRKHLEQQE